MYILYYDSQCPVCTGISRSLKKTLPSDKIQILPLPSNEDIYKLRSPKGTLYYGDDAISLLIKEFPTVKGYFSILPSNLQAPAIKATIKLASTLRNITKPKSPCNCNKKR